MRTLASFLTLSAFVPLVFSASYDLCDLSWSLHNENGSIVVPASVPSQVHLDLLNAGIITEPLLGINDFTERWIISDNWTYTADISSLLKNVSDTSSSLLVFYGIDTVANITLGNQPVAWVNNQFRQYVFDVSHIVAEMTPDNTNLSVALESAWLYGVNVTERPDAEFIPPDFSDNFEYPGVRQWVRKVADDFGWDWGPAFVPTGIFKPAFFVTLDLDDPQGEELADLMPTQSVFLEETSLEVYKQGQTPSIRPNETADWIVNVTLGLRTLIAASDPSFTISFPELNFTASAPAPAVLAMTNDTQLISAAVTLPEGLPQRWYTHNLGTGPKLYNVSVTLSLSPSQTITWNTTTGFRTIFLAQMAYSQDDIDSRGITPGDQWHFELNGKPFYSLGTNIIPFDPFYSRITSDRVRWVLESAKASGQNMLRVWGGGIYQPSSSTPGVYDFYDLCDELGILAWSELIFSDTLYPINDFLLESIEPEVRQNVRRTNRNPSVAQWAGGNEIEGIVISANNSLANGSHYLDEFVTLFQNFLHDIVTSETHSVAYTDCSTTNGVLTLDPLILRFENKTAGSIYGNSERYLYDGTQAFNYSTFPVSRFVNEFGYHSMPSFYSWEEVLQSPEDFSFNSTVVMSRDHHPPAGNLSFPNPNAPQGQYQMTQPVELWLPTPGTDDTNQTFAQWCWSTQIFQSMTMLSQITWYRRGAGQGERNLGSLVWQLNDIWQGVSWSSIEYSGRWKVLNYGMANVYSPVIISPFWTPDNQTFEVLVTSDRWTAVTGTAQLTWFDWGGNVLDTSIHDFVVPPLNNSILLQQQGLENILPPASNLTDVWLHLNLTAEVDGQPTTNENFFSPASLAAANIVDPAIVMTTEEDLTFTLSATGGVAPWTWLDHPSGTVGYFVDNSTNMPLNGFYLIPGQDRTVKFLLSETQSQKLTPSAEEFVVKSLWNNQHV